MQKLIHLTTAALALAALPGLAGPGITDAGFPMVDPKLDDPAKPWCYFTHPISCIGMPWMPEAIQVTPEGNLFTGTAEFCLFWGADRKPMASRQRHFAEGYIPIVQDRWSEGALTYDWEAFGAILEGFDEANTLQFIKLTIRNTGTEVAPAQVVAAIRQNGGPRREHAGGFNPNWRYEIKENQLWRDGSLVCAYTVPERWEAANGVPYDKPFSGRELGLSPRSETGLAVYRRELKPGEAMELVFKMPRVPTKDPNYLTALTAADYSGYRKKTVDYWTTALTKNSVIHTPGEPLVEQAHRATAAHVMLGTRTRGGKRTQTDGLPYPDLFISAIYDYGQLYENFGLGDFIMANFPHCQARQQPNGLFVDIAVSHGAKIHCAHGQTTAYISDHIVNTRNAELGRQMFPNIQKAVELIREEHKTQPHGLMSPAHPYDNEMIKGQWTSHNYWTLIGLRSAIRLAGFLGEKEVAADWLALYNDYEQTVLKAVRESAAPDGYVPTGLYGFVTGPAARSGFDEYRTDQDWENEMLLWPTELVAPGDPLVAGTLKRLRDTKFREGIMTYRNGQHLHQYITTRAINQFTANGQPQEALVDMYQALLHSGGAYESFENMIRPWTDRDVEFCPPPHAWGCCNSCNTIRNLFVIEQGGRGGLEAEQRDLMLLNAVSPAWLKDGEALGIEKAPTSFGLVTILMTPRPGGADVALKTDFHTRPHTLVVRIPYFVKLDSFKSDAKEAVRAGDVIRLSPDATKLALEWTLNPGADKDLFQKLLLRHRREVGHWQGKRSEVPKAPPGFLSETEQAHPTEPLSFALILSAWKTEYARRFAEHVKAGGNVKKYESVPIQPAEERKMILQKRDAESLTTGRPATCSSATKDHPAELANDGELAEIGYWESTEAKPWWQVDLGEGKQISMVRVVPYYRDPNRYYQFVVKTSVDGKKWETFLDLSDNTKHLGKDGASYTGQPTPVRYLRVEMLKNSANEGKHLVEVIAR